LPFFLSKSFPSEKSRLLRSVQVLAPGISRLKTFQILGLLFFLTHCKNGFYISLLFGEHIIWDVINGLAPID
ncbi:MAG: hypothetical protein V3U37_07075, partial [Nitrospinaceae bacterium]